MKYKMRDMDLDLQTRKKWGEECETNLKNLNRQFESVRNERNLCTRNLLAAKVS